MGIKKILFGEPIPDKNDPKYKERYEREKEAGRKFADRTGISWIATRLQSWGQKHSHAFIVIVFGIVLLCLGLNVYRLIDYSVIRHKHVLATEIVDETLREKNIIRHGEDSTRSVPAYRSIEPMKHR